MFGNSYCSGSTSSSNDQLPYSFPSDFLNFPPASSTNYHLPPAAFFPPPPLAIPAAYEFDLVSQLKSTAEYGYTISTSCSGCDSPSSLASYNSPMQGSVSSHSLVKKVNGLTFNQLILSPTATELFDWETSSMRRVFSAGDLQGPNMVQNNQRSESPLSNESSTIIESMSKACRYSPEEKKERIERYRSKRNQRNFNKKIKYVCRKTLADSRPRIKGRFARNDEIEIAPENQCSNQSKGGEEDFDEDDDNWINFLDSFSANIIP